MQFSGFTKAAFVVAGSLFLTACDKAPSSRDIARAVDVSRVDSVACKKASNGRSGYICTYRPMGSLMSVTSRFVLKNNRWRHVR